jgi:hypothetical protein
MGGRRMRATHNGIGTHLQDHLRRESEARETRWWYLDWTTATMTSHPASVPT